VSKAQSPRWIAALALAAGCARDRAAGSVTRDAIRHPAIAWVRGDDPRVRVEGRAVATPDGPVFAWPAVTVHLRFRGRTLDLRLRDTLTEDVVRDRDSLGVFIDGAPMNRLALREGPAVYRVAMRLPEGEHVVSIVKLTEAEAGAVTVLGVGTDGTLLTAPPARPRRLIAIGDSVTAGYGVDGPPGCHYSADYADAARSWVVRAARSLGAELHVVAWSGRGVVWNYSDQAEGLMPALMERALPADPASVWDWAAFVPDAVVVNLGTNDVARTQFDATTFARGYTAVVDRLRALYPRARILVAVGPLISDDDPVPGAGRLTRMRATLQAIVEEHRQRGDANLRFLELSPIDAAAEGHGCDQHPSAATHARLAATLTAALADLAAPRVVGAAIADRGNP
jgi:lysophospholipase L1-like esterase